MTTTVKHVTETDIPEELPDRTPRQGYQVQGEVIDCGFVEPLPSAKEYLEKHGSYTNAQFLLHVKPLNVQYETDPTFWEYEPQFGNDLAAWLDYRSGNGDIKGPNSFFGLVKGAFANLGHRMLTSEDCEALVGKRFSFWYGPPVILDSDGKPMEVKQWIPIPEAELPEDYSFTGTPKTIFRPKKYGEGKVPVVALSDEVMDKIVDALDGATTTEYLKKIAQARLPKEVNRELVSEATNGVKLTKRMTDSGKMKVVSGKLVRA